MEEILMLFFFTRELFTFSPAQLEELTQHFSVRALWLSYLR